jgi:hypothetical protein
LRNHLYFFLLEMFFTIIMILSLFGNTTAQIYNNVTVCDCSVCTGSICSSCSNTCICGEMPRLYSRYGKYCGVYYTGCTDSMPCDQLDLCCAHHDHCVGCQPSCGEGYTSCECNIGLIECVKTILLKPENSFCNYNFLAAKNIVRDICEIVSYAPLGHGGCEKEIIPEICINTE